MLNTPILFIVFNRPDTTQLVFNKIREQKPSKLYITSDGPRLNNETDKSNCEQVKAIVDNIDWPCDVKRLYAGENLGFSKRIKSALQWFFENEEMGIILEDDCLPDLSFFPFCEKLLQYYRLNEEVMHISGSNFQFGKVVGDGSYYFSKIARIWGWATWRRAWQKVDFELNHLDAFLEKEKNISQYWKDNLINTRNHKIDTWDFQWIYTIWLLNGKSITPNVNLVRNIGYNEDATHTVKAHWWESKIVYGSIPQIIHPSDVRVNEEADVFLDKIISNIPLTFTERIFMRINRIKYRLLNKKRYTTTDKGLM